MDTTAAWQVLADFKQLTSSQREYLEALAHEHADKSEAELAQAMDDALEARWPKWRFGPMIAMALAAYEQLRGEVDPDAPSGLRPAEIVVRILALEPPIRPREE